MSAKLERLLNLTAALLATRRPLTAEELRTRVEGYPEPGPTFRRTFERDKDDLRSMGIPLVVERVPGTDPPTDGYRVRPEDYYLPDPGLQPDELAALHLASLVVRVTSEDHRSAIWKLGGSTEHERDEVEALASIPLEPLLTPLFSAVTARRAIGFDYRRGADDQPEARRVEPWRLDFHRGRWYLTAWDRDRRGERHFRLDRIVSDVADEDDADFTEPVQPRDVERPLPGWELGTGDPVMVRLRVDEHLVPHVAATLGPDAHAEADPTEGSEKGDRVFTVAVRNWPSFRSFVLGLLDGAELVEPDELRTELVDWLTARATVAA